MSETKPSNGSDEILSMQTIEHIAHLARLGLNPDERAAAAVQLGAMLSVFAALERCEVSQVQGLFHPGDLALHCRADVVSESDQRAAFHAIAPDVAGEMYLVPKVLESA